MNGFESRATTIERRSDIAGWFFIGALGVAALYLGFVHVPQRIKLSLLSPLVLGALAGWGLGRWALARRVSSARLVCAAAFGLIAAGQVLAALETYRLGVKAIRTELNHLNLEHSPLADQIEQGLIDTAEDDATRNQLRNAHEDAHRRRTEEIERQDRLLTFAGYLQSRIPAEWGRWPPPWPQLYWVTEIVLSSTLGAWLVRRSLEGQASEGRQPPDATDSNAIDR